MYKKVIKNIFQKIGVKVSNYYTEEELTIIGYFNNLDFMRRIKILENHKINTLFDIGANSGQYAQLMRDIGYKGQIISFEPLNEAFSKLKENAVSDNQWIANNYALGHENTKTKINVAGNSFSSSLLDMLPEHYEGNPSSKYENQEAIELKKLDTIFHDYCNESSNVMVKIDTQGFEKNVLDGAQEVLDKITILQLEMSIVPLYRDEMLFLDMMNHLNGLGFKLLSLENGFENKEKGHLLQVDGIFVNRLHE